MRYIDADKLICAIDGAEALDTERDYDEVARFIEEAETADVEEVRHGRRKEWNYPGEEYVECTACFTRYYQDDLLMGTEEYPPYCPGCGAKMDEKETK